MSERMTGKELADIVTLYVNRNPTGSHADFTKTVLSEHKTLQQATIRLCFNLIKAMAQQNCIDDRNEDCVNACKVIIERCSDDMGLRYI